MYIHISKKNVYLYVYIPENTCGMEGEACLDVHGAGVEWEGHEGFGVGVVPEPHQPCACGCALIIYLSIYAFTSVYLSIYLSIHLSIYPSIYLSICLSTYIYLYIYMIHYERLINCSSICRNTLWMGAVRVGHERFGVGVVPEPHQPCSCDDVIITYLPIDRSIHKARSLYIYRHVDTYVCP